MGRAASGSTVAAKRTYLAQSVVVELTFMKHKVKHIVLEKVNNLPKFVATKILRAGRALPGCPPLFLTLMLFWGLSNCFVLVRHCISTHANRVSVQLILPRLR